MSRIGKQPIEIPQGVKAVLSGNTVTVNGPGGNVAQAVHPDMTVKIEGQTITVGRKDDTGKSKGLHGLTRTLIANMVIGAKDGFEKKLELVGVGYKAEVKGESITLALGFSHPVNFSLPKGVKATVEKQTIITLKGADKQLVGQVAADIRAKRPPEPYKGKGVKYVDEVIRRKAGKAGKAGAAGGK
ncbi:MAG: 50S ribosomal protein L6 [Thermodesulfobacteriota bacterium]